jgi:hypothetical protein
VVSVRCLNHCLINSWTSHPASLFYTLHITHKRFGSSSDPSINGRLHYPSNDLDRSLNEDVTDKIRQYRVDYNNRPSNAISFISGIPSTSGPVPLPPRGVRLTTQDQSGQHTMILTKVVTLRINLNIDGEPIVFKSHTHRHSYIGLLFTSCFIAS